MPISQDDIDHEPPASNTTRSVTIEVPTSRIRRLSEESIRTELCEGPVSDSPIRPSTPRDDDDVARTSDRAELIERLKRGESPTWIPNRHLKSILQHEKSLDADRSSRKSPESPSLLPPAPITPEKSQIPDSVEDRLRDGLDIERPRSALHTGDFTSDEAQSQNRHHDSPRLRDERRRPSEHDWFATSPPRDFSPFPYETRSRINDSSESFRSAASPLSSSLSSFVYQPPTSPLVQSETNEQLDFSMPLESMNLSANRLGARRYTLNSTHISPLASPLSRPFLSSRPYSRREGSLPYQAHQPRRSLTSTPSFSQQHGTSPKSSAFLRSRRPSFGSDTSPIQHASMVGSYEESILRGRMSSTPSKPFEFLAQIGVLGKGNCKSSLRCPPHVTLPFQAVYYNYSSTAHGRSRSDDGPSPYVGQVDLENGLSNSEEESRSRRKAQSRYSDLKRTIDDGPGSTERRENEVERRKSTRPKRRSTSPRAPPGGSYRLPGKGQIQIIIKNQNKTAVKLFLVPYDLTGMTPATKTFIRQRSYSAGPIIDNAPSMLQPDSMDRPILRYLIHIHICCPSKGRYYLYKSIRIVFANRVPDGKEKLRNETTWPEPRFTPYKPIRVMNPPLSTSGGPGAILAAEKAFRRRSLGVPVGASMRTFDLMDGIGSPSHIAVDGPPSSFGMGNTVPVDAIPLRLPPTQDCIDSDNNSDATSVTAGLRSVESANSRPSTKDSAASLGVWGAAQYEKLNKGDVGYGGNAFSLTGGAGVPGTGTEGLLSRRLKGLGVKPRQASEQDD